MNFSKIGTFLFAFFAAGLLVTIIVLISILISNKPLEIKPIENTRFGKIEIFGNSNKDGTLVIYLSESGNLRNSNLLNGIIQKGGIVAHINLDTYLKNSKDEKMNDSTPCYEYAGEFTRLAQVLQKELKMNTIDKTIFISHGNKASTLGLLMQEYLSSEIFFSFSIFDDELINPFEICADQLLNKIPKDKLLISKISGLKSKTNFSNWVYLNKKNSNPNIKSTYEVNSLYLDCKTDNCPLYDRFMPKNKIQTSSMPLIENMPENITSDYYVIFLSGDGGWATIDKEITKNLNKEGIPIIGVNSLKYFWRKKTPDRFADDIKNLISTYNNKLGKNKVILLGFSLGANMIPFANSRIAKENSSIIYSALLSPTKKTEFEIRFTDWIPGNTKEEGFSILEEIKKTPNLPGLCIAGEEDSDSVCHENLPDNFNIKKVKGSHHFNEDYLAVSSILLEEFTKSAN